MFVQDNALLHVSRGTVVFLDKHGVAVMNWPAMSPDMDPIEHVWDQMSIWVETWIVLLPMSSCPPSVVSSSGQKDEDTGGEHALSCTGSSRYWRGTHTLLIIAFYRLLHELSMPHGVWSSGF